MPTEREINDMITNTEWCRSLLENTRKLIQQNAANERPRDNPPSAPYDDEDTPMYHDTPRPAPYPVSHGSALAEVKKRRGVRPVRFPPHMLQEGGHTNSRNSARPRQGDATAATEWTRPNGAAGPDGARTLCNACGLHYAKLERKRLMENQNRSIRPKPDDLNHS